MKQKLTQAELAELIRHNADDPSLPAKMRAMAHRMADRFELVDPDTAQLMLAELEAMRQSHVFPELERTDVPERVHDYIKNNKQNLHRFNLNPGFIKTVSHPIVAEIWRNLEFLDLLHLPYLACWITFRLDDFLDHPGFCKQDTTESNITQMTASFICCDVLGTVVRDGKQTFNCPLADNIHLRTVDGREFNIHVPSGQLFNLNSRSAHLDEFDVAEF